MRRLFLLLVFALAAFDAAAQLHPERRQVRKGNRAYEKGNYSDAAGRYLRALGADSTSFEARYDLGNALYRQEMYDAAAEALQRAAADSLAPAAHRAEAFYNLGDAQFRQKRYAEALESFKNALRLNPADQQTKFNYAYVKKLLDDQNQQNQQNKDNQQDQNNQNGGGDGQNNQDPQQNKDNGQQDKDEGQQPSDPQSGDGDGEQPGEGGQPRTAAISPAEQERMLDAIQAQEDKTQEKLKDRAGAVVRLKKNW